MDIQTFLATHHQVLMATLAAVLGSGGVSLVTQYLKKAAKLENEHWIQVLFAAVAAIAAGLQYLAQNNHNLPVTVLGIHTAVLVGLGSQWYSHIIKPLNNGLQAVKQVDPNALADELSGVDASANQAASEQPPAPSQPTASF